MCVWEGRGGKLGCKGVRRRRVVAGVVGVSGREGVCM